MTVTHEENMASLDKVIAAYNAYDAKVQEWSAAKQTLSDIRSEGWTPPASTKINYAELRARGPVTRVKSERELAAEARLIEIDAEATALYDTWQAALDERNALLRRD